MALRAVFIGINKHNDLSIPELTGATKDAHGPLGTLQGFR